MAGFWLLRRTWLVFAEPITHVNDIPSQIKNGCMALSIIIMQMTTLQM